MKAIIVKYMGPTNSRGSRLKAFDGDGNSVTIPFPHELSRDDANRAAAKALCEKMGWHGRLTHGWIKGGAVFVFLGEETMRV